MDSHTEGEVFRRHSYPSYHVEWYPLYSVVPLEKPSPLHFDLIPRLEVASRDCADTQSKSIPFRSGSDVPFFEAVRALVPFYGRHPRLIMSGEVSDADISPGIQSKLMGNVYSKVQEEKGDNIEQRA